MTTFDYAQMDQRGLKAVVKWFNKNALPVAEVRGNNLPKRENGFQVKTVDIAFESGQVLTLKAKPDVSAFFQAKLNGKVLAIRDYKQLDNELRELANYVKINEPKYAKNKERALARAKVKITLPKAVNTTTKEQTDALSASVEELRGQAESISNQIVEVNARANLKSSELATLQEQLAEEKALTKQLEAEIEKVKSSNGEKNREVA